jgi:CrcB protein
VVGRSIGETFPWGTIVVNISGCLAAGALAAAAAEGGAMSAPAAWQVAVTGFLGSYTTVSSFSLQALALARDGQLLRAGGNVACSVALCLVAAAVGYYAAADLLSSAS